MEITPNIFSNRDQVNNFMRSKFHVKVPLSTASIGFALTDMEPQTSANGRVAVYHTDTTTKANLLSLFETHLEAVEKDLNLLATIPKVSVIYTPALPLRTLTKWGLVLVDASMVPRQTNVLYTLENRRIVKEVSFSIYQMFFGDVITPAWWDNRWVARGLSNYFSAEAVAQGEEDFLVDTVHKVIQEAHGMYSWLSDYILYSRHINNPNLLLVQDKGKQKVICPPTLCCIIESPCSWGHFQDDRPHHGQGELQGGRRKVSAVAFVFCNNLR